MTVSYTSALANASLFGCYWSVLFRWRGSVYKLIWLELLAYLVMYYAVNISCRLTMNNDEAKTTFYDLRAYLSKKTASIPISFVLGYYVTLTANRWWEQFELLPIPDTMALFISAAISPSQTANTDQGRMMRRTIMRYIVLAYVITLMKISLRARKRFPTYQHVVDFGIMLESEKTIFESMDAQDPMSKHWMPLVWATNIINTARKQELIDSDHFVQTIMGELSLIRQRLTALIDYDSVSVPLVYTQVVSLAVYLYFATTLVSRQMLPDPPENAVNPEPNFYFPTFIVLEFVFYVGWLKVAEVLLNPFGEDDDDLEVNWLIDRHIKAAYMIVDEMHEEYPEMLRDRYWDEVVPTKLPYTVASGHSRLYKPKGSAEYFKIKESDAAYADASDDDDDEDQNKKVTLQTETKTEDV